jgi:hypothetical protein
VQSLAHTPRADVSVWFGIRSDGRCGRDFPSEWGGETKCGNGHCCSSHGWCGHGEEYCSVSLGCQNGCWAPTKEEEAKLDNEERTHHTGHEDDEDYMDRMHHYRYDEDDHHRDYYRHHHRRYGRAYHDDYTHDDWHHRCAPQPDPAPEARSRPSASLRPAPRSGLGAHVRAYARRWRRYDDDPDGHHYPYGDGHPHDDHEHDGHAYGDDAVPHDDGGADEHGHDGGEAEGGPELVGLDEKQHLGDGDGVPLQAEQ